MIIAALLFTCCAFLSRTDGKISLTKSNLFRRSYIGETKGVPANFCKKRIAGALKHQVPETEPRHGCTYFIGCDKVCQKECIQVHNKYRANHDASPLAFDQKLADEAQALIDKGVFRHSEWVELKNKGAAFAWGSLFPSFTAVIKNWHDEGAYYDYQTGAPKKNSQVVDHFMQMIWKKAHKIGCARGGLYGEPWYVAHYDQAPISQKQNTVENIERPKQDDSEWFKDDSPFSEELANMQHV